jgi:low affinity Fe/Cu permease
LYLLTSSHIGINAGDIVFQLILIIILLAIPLAIIVVFFVQRKRNKRIARIEDKLDKLLMKKDKENS